jgi:ATP-binding cassette subfamily B protein
LFPINLPVACTAISVFGAAYCLLLLTTRRRLASNSRLYASFSKQQVKALQEGLGAIRDVLLEGSQAAYLEIYRRADRPMRLVLAQNNFLGAFPRFGLEVLGLLLIALLAIVSELAAGQHNVGTPFAWHTGSWFPAPIACFAADLRRLDINTLL